MTIRPSVFIGTLFVLGAAALFASLAHLGPVRTDDQRVGIHATASFYPLFYLAREIAGERASVSFIVPPGAEPHDYELTPQDMIRLQTSDIVILQGAGLEPWQNDVEHALNDHRTTIVIAGEASANRIFEDEDGNNVTDPHTWLSPKRAHTLVDAILAGFVKADPAFADAYRANAADLTARLAALDAEYAATLASCRRYEIVTSHSAFGYLAADYGLEQVSIAGLSPEEEPSPKALAEVARFARAHGVTHIFFETLVAPDLAETIAREVGAQTLVLNPIEGLTHAELAAGKDYMTAMRSNLAHLSTALSCTIQ